MTSGLSLLSILGIEYASTRPGTPQVGDGECRAVWKSINGLTTREERQIANDNKELWPIA
jgi:hypothetical protein